MSYVDNYLNQSVFEGNRNHSFFFAVLCAREDGWSESDMRAKLIPKALSDGLPQGEVNETFASAMRRPITLREKRPYRKPGEGRPLTWTSVIGLDGGGPSSMLPEIEPCVLPEPREGWDKRDFVEFLQALFNPGEFISYNAEFTVNEKNEIKPKGWGIYQRDLENLLEWAERTNSTQGVICSEDQCGAWIRLNPMDGKGVYDSNVVDFRHVLVESDSMPVEEQLALLYRLQVPCTTIVHSGKKSIHAAVRIDAGTDRDLYNKRVLKLYAILGENGLIVDQQNKNPSRLSRLPGVTRDGSPQYLIDRNTGAASWADFEALVDSTTVGDMEFADLLNWRTLAAMSTPWIFKETIPDLTVTVIGAQGGIGKSMFVTGLALSAIQGKTLFPSFQIEKPVPVMLFAGEDSLHMICRRILAYAEIHKLNHEILTQVMNERLFLQSLQAKPMLQMTAARTLESTDFFRDMLESAKRHGVKLIILDTSRKFGGYMNEIDNVQIGAFMELCAQLAKEVGCGVLILHHSSKIAANDSEARQTDFRGGSAFGDEARCGWIMKRRTDGRVVLTNTKQSYGKPAPLTVLQFTDDGALVEAGDDDPYQQDAQDLMNALRQWLVDNPQASVTKRDLLKKINDGFHMNREITQEFPNVTGASIANALENAKHAGLIRETKQKSDGRAGPKRLVLLPGDIERWAANESDFDE